MLQSEFTKLTNIHVTAELFEDIHKQYMDSELDKIEWCKQYKRKHEADITKAMANEIYSLQEQIEKLKEHYSKTIGEKDIRIVKLNNSLYKYKTAICNIWKSLGGTGAPNL